MKKLFLSFSVLLLAVSLFAQEKPKQVIKFKETTYDFGKIKQGVPVNHDFAFTNVDAKPAVIEVATATCGCTTPTWPQQPVAKGKSDKINAGFSAQAVGPFEKTITVKVAGVALPMEIRIKGEVLTTDDYVKYEAAKKTKKSGSK
ncbi:MAG: DUF1573 domain-containing protein [Gemmatimonadaceae bacterium]|nr:DUF1573 domain-containing protein [Chitinophagaceae bacterium]